MNEAEHIKQVSLLLEEMANSWAGQTSRLTNGEVAAYVKNLSHIEIGILRMTVRDFIIGDVDRGFRTAFPSVAELAGRAKQISGVIAHKIKLQGSVVIKKDSTAWRLMCIEMGHDDTLATNMTDDKGNIVLGWRFERKALEQYPSIISALRAGDTQERIGQ